MKRMTHFSISLDLRSFEREGGMKNRRRAGGGVEEKGNGNRRVRHIS